jgi:Phage portal protein
MGLRDRLLKATAKALVEELKKAPKAPAGSVVMSEADMLRGSQGTVTYGNQNPLPRNPLMSGVPFGPGQPILPGAINPLGADGRAEPRRYEYQVAQNINIGTEQKLVDFKTLRGAAEQIDIVRRCLEVIKSKISAIDWDITIAEDATEKIISEIGGDHVRAMALARNKFADDIYRCRVFWEKPDPANGMKFVDWLMVALEDVLVLDALAIWPQKTVGGDLFGLQILDGSTIKPLLDDRGMRPMPPNPAFQQILYGFPRTEFTAPTEDADGEFTSDQLTYIMRNRRSFSAYGNSPVERALPVADLYLRRQQWLRAEYTDGVLPELMFKVDPDFGNDPRLLRELENVLNDDLAGQTEQRHRAKVLPAGFDPVSFDGYGEKFREVLDTYLVTSICGHFGVLPTEIGFSGHGGLGNSGHQAGEERSAQQIGVGPLVKWLSEVLTDLSYQYLSMPRELEFKFMWQENIDSNEDAQRADIEIRGAARTINERRAEIGLPLLDTPAADQPMLVAGNSVFIFSPDGIINATTATGEPPSVDNMDPKSNPIAPVQDKPAPVAPIVAPINGESEQKPSEPKADEQASELVDDKTKAGVPTEANAIDAISRLKALPNAAGNHAAMSDKDGKDLIESPWPLANDHLDTTDGIPMDPDLWQTAELELVDIKELYATDTVLNRDKVADRIESMGQSLLPFKNYPMVYNDGEKNIIMDGHHRLMAMWLLGMDKVPVWLASADNKKAASVEVKAFLKWASKGKRARQFEFKSLDPIVGEALNRCYFENDMETARSLAKAFLS